METLLYILSFYFLTGALMIVFIGRKLNDTAKRNELWTKYFVYLGIVSLVLTAIYYELFFVLALLIAALGLYEMIAAWISGKEKKTMVLVAGLLVYLVVAFFFLVFAYSFSHQPWNRFVALFYAGAVIFDGFSQLSGQLFGMKKMTPNVSPNKTWAGFEGGAVMTLISIIVFAHFDQQFHAKLADIKEVGLLFLLWLFILPCLAGDLLASLYKRKCGVKDFSNWIPGHGGILDRFDSTIMMMAVVGILFV